RDYKVTGVQTCALPIWLACQALPRGSLTGSTVLILRGICNFEVKINFAQQAGAVAATIYTDADRPDPIPMAVGAATLPATMVSLDRKSTRLNSSHLVIS